VTQYIGKYVLTNLTELYPDEALQQIFQRSLNELMRESKRKGEAIDWIAFSINSQLLDSSFGTNLHHITEDTAAFLARKFELIDQSNRAKGRAPLIEEPFTINISAINREALKKNRKKQQHVGKGKRRHVTLRPNINPHALLYATAPEGDNLCLFRAVNLLRAKNTMNRQRFFHYKLNFQWQDRDVQEMIKAIGVPAQDAYSFEIFGFLHILSLSY